MKLEDFLTKVFKLTSFANALEDPEATPSYVKGDGSVISVKCDGSETISFIGNDKDDVLDVGFRKGNIELILKENKDDDKFSAKLIVFPNYSEFDDGSGEIQQIDCTSGELCNSVLMNADKLNCVSINRSPCLMFRKKFFDAIFNEDIVNELNTVFNTIEYGMNNELWNYIKTEDFEYFNFYCYTDYEFAIQIIRSVKDGKIKIYKGPFLVDASDLEREIADKIISEASLYQDRSDKKS